MKRNGTQGGGEREIAGGMGATGKKPKRKYIKTSSTSRMIRRCKQNKP